MSHTKEPWGVYEGEEIHGVLDSDGKHLAEMWQRKHYDSLANAQRIVACVNACADMDDPAKELAAKDARIAELESGIETINKEVVRLAELLQGWAEFKLTDESWEEWRKENPKEVEKLKAAINEA